MSLKMFVLVREATLTMTARPAGYIGQILDAFRAIHLAAERAFAARTLKRDLGVAAMREALAAAIRGLGPAAADGFDGVTDQRVYFDDVKGGPIGYDIYNLHGNVWRAVGGFTREGGIVLTESLTLAQPAAEVVSTTKRNSDVRHLCGFNACFVLTKACFTGDYRHERYAECRMCGHCHHWRAIFPPVAPGQNGPGFSYFLFKKICFLYKKSLIFCSFGNDSLMISHSNCNLWTRPIAPCPSNCPSAN
jgi:hypothetical protein